MNMDNEPRMQDRSPEGLIFSIESDIKNMMKDYEVAVRNGENQRAQMIADAIDRMQKKKIELQGGIADMAMRQQMAKGGESSFPDLTGDGQVTQADILKGKGVELAGGGEASVQEYIKMLKNKMDVAETNLVNARQGKGPNLAPISIPSKKMVQLNKEYLNAKDDYERAIRSLTKGNIKEYKSKGSIGQFFSPMSMTPAMAPSEIKKFEEYTKAQGMAEGGEAIGDELAGIAMSEEEAMAEVGNAEKEMQMIQQLVTVVQQLLAEGISEDDLVAFLKEQGLDDEDIDSLMQMVLQSQSEQAPDQIGQELQGMM